MPTILTKLQVMLNRGWRDVVADILETSKGGANKTTIMYKSFLSYSMLTEYFDLLLQANLMTFNKKAKLYNLTEEGMEFLKLYDEMNKLVFPPNMKLHSRKGIRK